MIFTCLLIASLAIAMGCFVPSLAAMLVMQLNHIYLWLCLGAGILAMQSLQAQFTRADAIHSMRAATKASPRRTRELNARHETLSLCIAYHTERICKLQEATTTNVELIHLSFSKAARESELAIKNASVASLDKQLKQQRDIVRRLEASIRKKEEVHDVLKWEEKTAARRNMGDLELPAYVSPSGSPLPVYTSTPPSPKLIIKAKPSTLFALRPLRMLPGRKMSA